MEKEEEMEARRDMLMVVGGGVFPAEKREMSSMKLPAARLLGVRGRWRNKETS